MLDAEWFDENQMNVSAVPSAEPCDSQRRLHARPGSQTGGQDPLSKFASLLDPACLVPTWTGLAEVAQPIEHVPAPASGAATRPSNIVPPRGPRRLMTTQSKRQHGIPGWRQPRVLTGWSPLVAPDAGNQRPLRWRVSSSWALQLRSARVTISTD